MTYLPPNYVSLATLTLRIPDDKAARLRELAKRRKISANAETRFRLMAARGSAAKGLKLLDKLDKGFAKR